MLDVHWASAGHKYRQMILLQLLVPSVLGAILYVDTLFKYFVQYSETEVGQSIFKKVSRYSIYPNSEYRGQKPVYSTNLRPLMNIQSHVPGPKLSDA